MLGTCTPARWTCTKPIVVPEACRKSTTPARFSGRPCRKLPQPNHYPVHEPRETSRETTRFFRSHLPIFSGCAPKCDQGNQKYVDFSTLCEVPNSLRKFLFSIIDVDFNYCSQHGWSHATHIILKIGRMLPKLF